MTRDSSEKGEMTRPCPHPRPRPKPQHSEFSLCNFLADVLGRSLGLMLTPFMALFGILCMLYLSWRICYRFIPAIWREPPTPEEFERLQCERDRDRKHARILAWIQQPGRIGDCHCTKEQAVQTQPSHGARPLLKRRMTN